MSTFRLLFSNGVLTPSSDTPVSTILEAYPGAYTTSRTHNDGSHLLFWDRHIRRLAESSRILFNLHRELLFKPTSTDISLIHKSTCASAWESVVSSLVDDSMRKVLPVALKQRKSGEELAITTLLSGNLEKLGRNERVDEENISRVLDVFIHVAAYVPPMFGIRDNFAYLAVVGSQREVANAKYSDWVRLRKSLEKLRPPLVTELLLTSDGNQVLEGCSTNFFVVRRKNTNVQDNNVEHDNNNDFHQHLFEVQTAPVSDGVLPGVVRQVIIEVCLKIGIPFREVAPLWSERESWEEAFITNSLRLLQHVEKIQIPTTWESMEAKTWRDLTWTDKLFKGGPGRITTLIQENIMESASLEEYPVT